MLFELPTDILLLIFGLQTVETLSSINRLSKSANKRCNSFFWAALCKQRSHKINSLDLKFSDKMYMLWIEENFRNYPLSGDAIFFMNVTPLTRTLDLFKEIGAQYVEMYVSKKDLKGSIDLKTESGAFSATFNLNKKQTLRMKDHLSFKIPLKILEFLEKNQCHVIFEWIYHTQKAYIKPKDHRMITVDLNSRFI